MVKQFFVTGIGTEVGKTLASAILVKALQAEYWKPVQCGDLDNTDTHKIQRWAQHPSLRCHPERYALQMPASPHKAAAAEGVDIQLQDFALPPTDGPLIVEGAGGLLVPLNHRDTIADLIHQLGLPVILVSRHYLGSINHSLLSLAYLRERQIPLHGILFSGEPNESTEDVILQMTNAPCLGRIGEIEEVNADSVQYWAEQLAPNFRK
ncbi:MAG: dethiobiotin synthase [Bacteroidota bacterium]